MGKRDLQRPFFWNKIRKCYWLLPLFLYQNSASRELSFLENSIYPIQFISSISKSIKKEVIKKL